MTAFFTCLALLAAHQSTPAGAHVSLRPVSTTPPNLVVIVADDCGVDLIGAYGEGPAPACTPNIDSLASSGMLFRNAWANPVCSPSRAALLTGRYGFRTGIGWALENGDAGLPLAETTLPEALGNYDSACIGKWHLSGTSGNLHPNSTGFVHFAGFLGGAVPSYTQWPKVVDGQTSMSATYTTTDITNEAIGSLATMQEPWILYVAYNALHAPLHVPPSSVCAPPTCATTYCGNLPSSPTNRQLGRAMLEALDREIGRLLSVVTSTDPDAYVVFVGDNGTAPNVSQPPFLGSHAKGTTYEGGVNVPLIVKGPSVAVAECAALVSVVDLFATLVELGRATSAAADSVSMVPYFSNPSLSLRSSVYTESFQPNGGSLPFTTHDRAVRDARYKLIRTTGMADKFFDLQNDPFETDNLLPGLDSVQRAAHDALEAEFVALGVG